MTQQQEPSKRRRVIIIISIVIGLLLIVGLFMYCSHKKSVVSGSDGTINVQDTTMVEGFDGTPNSRDTVVVDTPTFTLNTVMAVGGINTPLNDLASFQQLMIENVSKAQSRNDGTVEFAGIYTLFDLGSAKIRPYEMTLLDKFTSVYLQTNRQAIIVVEGYTCNLGSNAINNTLSHHRVQSIQRYLIEKGIPTDNIEIHWYGKTRNSQFHYTNMGEYRRVIITIKH